MVMVSHSFITLTGSNFFAGVSLKIQFTPTLRLCQPRACTSLIFKGQKISTRFPSFWFYPSVRQAAWTSGTTHPPTAWNFWILRNLHSSLRDAATAEKLEINSPNWHPTMNGGKGWMTSDRFLVGEQIWRNNPLRVDENIKYVLNFERTHMKIVTPSFSQRQPHGIW